MGASDMKISSLVPWFGSKRTLAPTIVEELGPHRAYWEPFCGGLSVLLNKPVCGHETVNDLHRDLINLVRVIQHPQLGPALYRRLRRVSMHEHVLSEAWADLAKLDDAPPCIDRAFHYFVASWSGRNGFAGTTNVVSTKGIAVRWTPGGGHGGLRFTNAAASIPAWRRRIRRLTILNRDAFDVIEKIDDTKGVAIYIDPPYLIKNAEYEHDFSDGFMGNMNDHERLATALGRFKVARVVVSYYAHPCLRDLYAQWTWRDCTINKGIHNAGKRGQGGKKAPEILLTNGPSYATEAA